MSNETQRLQARLAKLTAMLAELERTLQEMRQLRKAS